MLESAATSNGVTAPTTDAALDAAAAESTGPNMLEAANLAWDALDALASGDRDVDRARSRALILLAFQLKSSRDWLLCQAAEHPDEAVACARAATCIAAAGARGLPQSDGTRVTGTRSGVSVHYRDRQGRAEPPPAP
jgi:hypothetical protein